ncbi:MAG: gliding motility-associated transport system permease protein [Candidatus Marinimicrobia bacterium]|jgi:ABC-2 type transport system permease protein|nr:gliding motility-associated transport system permease protein [Candidatus Neomarinimicrobiota bacterium]
MNAIRLIYRKEMSAYFNSAVAYITLIIFLLINGWFFTSSFFLVGQSDLRILFNSVPLVFIFFIPAITMGSLARENHAGTMEFLTTLPVDDYQIVLGKFFSAVALIGVGLLFTVPHFITLLFVGTSPDIGAILCGYVGLLLVGAMYASIGMFGSAVSNNQITSFLVSFIIIFALYLFDKILIFVPSFLSGILQFLSTDYHFSNISRGVIDSRNIIYFLSVIFFFLTLSVRVLEIRKWR